MRIANSSARGESRVWMSFCILHLQAENDEQFRLLRAVHVDFILCLAKNCDKVESFHCGGQKRFFVNVLCLGVVLWRL